MQFVIVLLVMAAVAVFVTAPLRRDRGRSAPAADLAELEAARQAKYREIRDADLDRRTGKLSEQDFAVIDRELRAEAMEILRALDAEREP